MLGCGFIVHYWKSHLIQPATIPAVLWDYLFVFSMSPRLHAEMKHTGGVVIDNASKAIEVREVDLRVPLAGNVGLNQPLYQTPVHKGRKYSSPNCSQPPRISVGNRV